MATEKVLQGTDRVIPLTLLADDGTALNLGGVDGIVVHLKDKDGNVVAKYNNPTKTDYLPIVIVDSANGKIEIKLESFTSKNIQPGPVFAEGMTETTDANFQNGIKFSADVKEVLDIIESSVKTEVDLTP